MTETAAPPLRLGFATKVMGAPGYKSYDSRRAHNHPHLSVSLAYVWDILGYLNRRGIRMYRLASELAPYLTHPEMPEFHHQIDECRAELAVTGERASQYGIRLSFHAGLHVSLTTSDPLLAERSRIELEALTELLDAMNLAADAVIVAHIGGAYDDKAAALFRACRRLDELTPAVRRRLVLEHDDRTISVVDLAQVAAQTGIPVVFDHLHFLLFNPEGLTLEEGVQMVLSTWPAGSRPKLHFSTARTEARFERDEQGFPVAHPPRRGEHSDYLNPFEFAAFARHLLRRSPGVDVMLEAKAKDLALLRLEEDLARDAADVYAALQLPSPGAIAETPAPYVTGADLVEAESSERVLVVVVNNADDWQRIQHEGWYRIPVSRAPQQVGADVLAFYLTQRAGDLPGQIGTYASVRRYRLATRADLLPHQANHARAADLYYCVHLGPLQSLIPALPAVRLRRISFIPTTWAKLQQANDISQLWLNDQTPRARLASELSA